MFGKSGPQVIVRIPSGLSKTSTTVVPTDTTWNTRYMYGRPNRLLAGYQSLGLAMVPVWSNFTDAPGATDCAGASNLATSLLAESKTLVDTVTSCAAVPS